MKRKRLALVLLAGVLAIFQGTATAKGDLILNNYFGSYRVNGDGITVLGYDAVGAEYVGTHALTLDGEVLYMFEESLGAGDRIIAVDADTGVHLSDLSISPASIPPAPPLEWGIPSQALFRSIDTYGLGDLFVAANENFPNLPPDTSIWRFNTATKSLVETIDPPTNQDILDFGFGLDGKMYVSTKENIYAYSEDPVQGFITPAASLIAGVHGHLAIGPDGNIYVNDPDTGTLDRYTPSGVFIDTFLPASVKTYGSITFDSQGNLYTYTEGYVTEHGENRNAVSKFALASGQLLATTYDTGLFPNDRISVLPVPEPSTLLLAVAGVLAALGRRGARD